MPESWRLRATALGEASWIYKAATEIQAAKRDCTLKLSGRNAEPGRRHTIHTGHEASSLGRWERTQLRPPFSTS